MQLQIQHTWPQIGIETKSGQMSIEVTKPQVQMTTQPAQLLSEGEPFRVEIDSYRCRAELGLKNNFDLLVEAKDRAQSAALAGIRSRAQQGDQMAAIHNKGNPIAEMGAAIVFKPPAEFNIAMLPSSRPEINFVGGKEISVQAGGVEIDVTPGSTAFDYQPGTVEIYLRQKAELKMEFVGSNLDIRK